MPLANSPRRIFSPPPAPTPPPTPVLDDPPALDPHVSLPGPATWVSAPSMIPAPHGPVHERSGLRSFWEGPFDTASKMGEWFTSLGASLRNAILNGWGSLNLFQQMDLGAKFMRLATPTFGGSIAKAMGLKKPSPLLSLGITAGMVGLLLFLVKASMPKPVPAPKVTTVQQATVAWEGANRVIEEVAREAKAAGVPKEVVASAANAQRLVTGSELADSVGVVTPTPPLSVERLFVVTAEHGPGVYQELAELDTRRIVKTTWDTPSRRTIVDQEAAFHHAHVIDR